VVFEAHDPAAKPLASRVFSHELSSPGLSARLAGDAGAKLVALGYHAQIHAQSDSAALFHLDGNRTPIHIRDGQFVVGGRQYSPGAAVELSGETPDRFSPGVLLRPVVQDTLFPTVCYVAGPNELAYLGQLRGVYEHFGVPMPLVYPRLSATILDAAAFRFLTRYELPYEKLQPQDDAALNDLLARQIPEAVELSFAEASRATELAMLEIVRIIPSLDPTLEGAARSTLGRMQQELRGLHTKMVQSAKRRDDTLRRQFTHTRALAFPLGHLQERTVGFASFLNDYGPALVARLDAELPLEMGWHWAIMV
jgi:bacillithiol synthase